MRKLLFIIPLLIITVVPIFSKDLEQDIKNVLQTYLGSIGGLQGAAVVDVQTGEFLGYYIPNPVLYQHKEIMAALVTNIVRDIEKSTKEINFHPVWLEVNTREAKILIALVGNEIFLGSRFSPNTPTGLIKFQMRKAMEALKEVLSSYGF